MHRRTDCRRLTRCNPPPGTERCGQPGADFVRGARAPGRGPAAKNTDRSKGQGRENRRTPLVAFAFPRGLHSDQRGRHGGGRVSAQSMC